MGPTAYRVPKTQASITCDLNGWGQLQYASESL